MQQITGLVPNLMLKDQSNGEWPQIANQKKSYNTTLDM